MLKRKKRIIAKVMATTMLATTLASTFAVEANAQEPRASVTSSKISGDDRYKTAVEISKNYSSTSKHAVVVNGQKGIVDALTATPYASLKKAPILMTQNNKLNEDTKKELTRRGIKTVDIIGGTASVSDSVKAEIEKMGITVNRIAGNSKYETSLKVAQAFDKISDISKIAVANGEVLADAVSVAAPAAQNKMPIILAHPSKGLDDATKTYINGEGISTSYVIGGTSSVSNSTQNSLPGTKKRLEGTGRQETNAKVVKEFYDTTSHDNIYVTKSGQVNKADEIADALAVGVLAAHNQDPVLIVGKNLAGEQKTLLEGKDFDKITEVGNGIPTASIQAIKDTQKDPEAQVSGVTLVNFKTIKLTGKELNRIDKSKVSISGNTTVSYTTNSAGTEATVEFANAFSNGTNTVRVTSNLGNTTSHSFTYNSEISSVQATSKEVALDGIQYLEFTVNGNQKRTVEELKALGWSVEFKSTKPVFYDASNTSDPATTSANGKLRTVKPSGAPSEQTTPFAEGEVFDYEIILNKGTTEIKSGKVAVTATNKVSENKEIKSWEVKKGNIKLTSNKLVVDESVTIENVKGTNMNNEEVNIANVTLESSNPAVVSATGNTLTAHSKGTSTITIKSGKLTKTFNITVETEARKLGSVSVGSTSAKLIEGEEVDIVVTVKDQYGDPVVGYKIFGDEKVDIKSGEKVIASTNKPAEDQSPSTISITNNEGKAVIKIEAEDNIDITGTATYLSGTLLVPNGTTRPAQISVSVSKDNVAKTWSLGLKDVTKDTKLDIYEAKNDTELTLNLKGYNAGGYLVGNETTILTVDNTGTTGDLWVKSSDTDKAIIKSTKDGDIVVEAKTKTGSVSISVYKDDNTRAVATIGLTIEDTTPKITSIKVNDIQTITKATKLSIDDLLNTTKIGNKTIVEGITMTGTKEEVLLGTENNKIVLFIDGSDKNGQYTEGELIIGSILLSTDFNGDISEDGKSINLNAGDKGNIIVKLYNGRQGEGKNPFMTKVIKVDIPTA